MNKQKITEAETKLKKEAGDDRFLKMMASQTTELMKERGTAGTVLKDGKSLKDLKKIFDKFAEEHKTGKQSVITPDEAAEMICDYYELGIGGAPAGGQADAVDILDMI